MHALNGNGAPTLPLLATRLPDAPSRRQRNRLAHALNGNTSVGAGTDHGMPTCPPDTAGSPAVYGFTLLGMRLVDERSDCFTELLLVLAEAARAGVLSAPPLMVPSSDGRETWRAFWNPWGLAGDVVLGLVAPMPVVCLLDHERGLARPSALFTTHSASRLPACRYS